MLAAQAREGRGRRTEYPTSMVAVGLNQSLTELMRNRVGSPRFFVTNQ